MVRRSSNRKPRRRAGGKRVARKSKRSSKATQFAMIKETIQFKDLAPNTANQLIFNLSQFVRAGELAKNFRWYKAAKVEWQIEPFYNLYIDNGGTTPLDTMPYIYNVMDRTQNSLGYNLADMQSTGAKPQKLISKKTYTFTPNWCSPGLATLTLDRDVTPQVVRGGTSQGLKAQYSYLACPDTVNQAPDIPGFLAPASSQTLAVNGEMEVINANAATYNGMDIWIEQANDQGNPAVARCCATVTWMFKDPKYNGFVREPNPVEPKLLAN